MTNLFRTVQAVVFGTMVAAGAFVLCGCGGSAAPSKPATGKNGPVKQEESLETASDLLRKATVLASYREALGLATSHLEKPAFRQKLFLSADERELLKTKFALDDEELEEVEATTYRLMDAHHVEAAFVLREVARYLEHERRAPLREAELAFAWVVRQVLLREGEEDFLPPGFVLKRGWGNARERLLVFLSLLQQFQWPHNVQVDGCVVALPAPEPDQPRPMLAGVCIGGKDAADIFLFDPRLGLPVPGPDGKGIATLAQVRKQPELLATAGSKPASGKMEVLLACPLTALAPRMRVLEEVLALQERVGLSLDPAGTLQRLSAAAQDKVGVWHSRTAAKTRPQNSPVRALRLFLPKDEGGIGGPQRFEQLRGQLVPWFTVRKKLADWRAYGELPASAREHLYKLSLALFVHYAVTPQDWLLRGREEQVSKRLDIIRSIYEDLDFAQLEDKDFRRLLGEWREQINKAELALLQQKTEGPVRLAGVWQDHFLAELLDNPDNRPKHPKKFLTVLLLGAARDSLLPEVHYRLALCWQEKAERRQAAWQQANEAGQAGLAVKKAEKEARSAWINTLDWWRKYSQGHALTPAAIKQRLAPVQQAWRNGDIDAALGLWDQLLREVQLASVARLYLARALEHSDKKTEASAALENLHKELADLAKNDELKKTLAACLAQAKAPAVTARLQAVRRDLGETGSLYWLQQTASARLQHLATKSVAPQP